MSLSLFDYLLEAEKIENYNVTKSTLSDFMHDPSVDKDVLWEKVNELGGYECLAD